jgi:outer membrane protein TolC
MTRAFARPRQRPGATIAMAMATAMIAAGLAMAPGNLRAADIDEFIRTARKMNPEAAAMALEADAASARVDAAGALDDPRFKTELELPRANPGSLPGTRVGQELYQLRQMFPLWGKRDLQRDIARWNSRGSRARLDEVENQLAYRVKLAYAEYHAAHLAADETRTLLASMRTLSDLARARYAQGAGKQQDVTTAEAERALLDVELARMDAERRRAQVRLNGLMARAPGTPLPPHPQPRPVPRADTLPMDALVERARTDFPAVRTGQAQAEAADSTRHLSERSWYPDVEVGLGAIRRDGRFDGYQAMVEFSIPLQIDRRRAEQREAAGMAAAARAKVDQIRQDVTTGLHEAHVLLEALAQRKRLLREVTMPQARIAVDAAMNAYQVGREELTSVLLAQQTLRRAMVETVTVLFDEQIRLAEIERLIGGEL